MPKLVPDNPFEKITGFEWDTSNLEKNLLNHRVHWQEVEEVFDNIPIITSPDFKHSTKRETRYQVLGQTNKKRRLFLALTVRGGRIRIISARDQDRQERRDYAQAEKA